MRIAYLSTFYPYRGGIAQFNASLFREFEKEHEVEAFTFTRQYPNFLFPGKTQMVSNEEVAEKISANRVLDSVNPITWLSTAKKIKAFNPDLLVMKYWMSFFGPSLGTVAKLMPKHTKVITIIDNAIPHEKRFFDTAFTKYFFNQNTAFVAMSDKVKDDIITLKPSAKVLRKEHPLYNHFGNKFEKETARKQLNVLPHKKTLLFFGFIRDYKGLDILIKAFDLINDDNYQLIIAGEPYGSFDKYQQLIDTVKLKNQIFIFKDYISDSEVPAFFSAADVCVLPYKSATQSGITSIAYHFNVPLIATDVGGLKESIIPGKTGLIVDKCEPAAIAASIKQYFDNNLTEAFTPAIQEMKEELSWSKFAEAILSYIK